MEQLIESKLIKADKAFSVWRKVPFEERQKLIAKAAEILKIIQRNLEGSLLQK